MSRTSRTTRNTRKRVGIGAATIALLGAVVLAFAPGAVSSFSDSANANVEGSTATLTVELNGSGDSGAVTLPYFNLAPGGFGSQTVTVSNTGTIGSTGQLTLDNLVFDVPEGQNPDLSQLMVGVAGQTPVSARALANGTAVIELGDVARNQALQVKVQVSLPEAVGNNWQGVGFTADAVFTLNQE